MNPIEQAYAAASRLRPHLSMGKNTDPLVIPPHAAALNPGRFLPILLDLAEECFSSQEQRLNGRDILQRSPLWVRASEVVSPLSMV